MYQILYEKKEFLSEELKKSQKANCHGAPA